MRVQVMSTPCVHTSALRAGTAGQDTAVAGGAAGVDDAEAGRCERGEHGRMPSNCRRDTSASDESGSDELERVGSVGFGAGRADGGAPVTARFVDHRVGHVPCGAAADHAAGTNLDGGDVAGQPDRVSSAHLAFPLPASLFARPAS